MSGLLKQQDTGLCGMIMYMEAVLFSIIDVEVHLPPTVAS
jgi:hypothetical protein